MAWSGDYTQYTSFGSATLSEFDSAHGWSNYFYVNGQRVAKIPGSDHRLHTQGTFNSGGNELRWNLPIPREPDGSTYTIHAGDKLCFRQYNHGGAWGGPAIGYSDGTTSAWHLQDSAGQTLNQYGVQDTWTHRCAEISEGGAHTGAPAWLAVLTDVNTPAGTWDILYADMVIASTDGTVRQIDADRAAPADFQGGSWSQAPVAAAELVRREYDQTVGHDAAAMHFYLADHLGTAHLELASSGYPTWRGQFTPYGSEIIRGAPIEPDVADGSDNHYKFTGKERDTESGLDYFGFRYYGSNMGRFMSPDLGADVFALPFANLKNPQTLNLYSYVGNNPLSRVDQDGHDFHVCADNGNGGQNCFNLTDDQYKNLYNQQNGQQGINLPGAGFGSSGTITCGGTACGTASYFEPGLQDASGPILVGVAGGVAGPGIVRSIFNAVTGLAGSGNSVTTTAVNTGDRASRLKQLFGTEGPGGVQGDPEGAARQALQRLQGSKQLPDGLSQSDLDFYRGVMDKAANSPNNPNTAVQSVRGEILNLAERILGGGK